MNTLTDLRSVCDHADRQFNHGQLAAALTALPADPVRGQRPDLADHARVRLLLTRARLLVSMIYLDGAEARPAHHALNDALRLAERRRDMPALAAAHHERGRLSAIEQYRFERPDYLTSRAHLEKALALREACGSHAEIAATLTQLGAAAQAMRQPDDAMTYTSRAYALARAHCHKPETAEAALNLGLLLRGRGDADGALKLLHESRRLREESGLRVWMPLSELALGETLTLIGHMGEARRHLALAADASAALRLRRPEMLASMALADWLMRAAQPSEALAELRSALRLAGHLRHESVRQRAAALIERLSKA